MPDTPDRSAAFDATAETLAKFVVRARRIEEHSLVQDIESLKRHAQGSLRSEVGLGGKVRVFRRLPDEERFESLAARVRPLTLAREPIHHKKVTDAIAEVLERAGDEADQGLHEGLEAVTQMWSRFDLDGTTVQGFTLQSANIDGTDISPVVSDTQLGAGWFYSDVAHSDPTGRKKDALRFPMKERFAAAVPVFARLTLVTLRTLDLVRALHTRSLVNLPQDAFDRDVVVNAHELVDEGQVYVGPVGAEMAFDLVAPGRPPGEEWTPLTVSAAAALDATRRVAVRCVDDDGRDLACYEGGVVRRELSAGRLLWHVLIDDAVTFHFEFEVQGEELRAPAISFESHPISNRLLLANQRFMLDMFRSDRLVFEANGQSLTVQTTCSDTELEEMIRALIDLVGDLVAIEDMDGCELPVAQHYPTDGERVRLRQIRLAMQGHLVAATRRPVKVSVPTGGPPQVIGTQPGLVTVAGVQIPIPATLMRHPDMQAEDLGPVSEAGPDGRSFSVSVPDNERFMLWMPERLQLAPGSDFTITAPWQLHGIDETSWQG
ncbi:MAG TPA: hypothetical protein VIJ07_12930 [Dermatophilaceae bacterium]|jgi:hypothetical protein